MAVDPPYRLDPLQNPVNVKWGGGEQGTGPVIEGFAPVSIGTVWFISSIGESGVGFPDGVGDLLVRGVNTSGPFSQIHGRWSGGSGSGSSFDNDGDGPFRTTPGGGMAGGFIVLNAENEPKGGAGDYNFGSLTFIQDNNHRVYNAVSGEAGFYDLSEIAGVPRFVTYRWRIRMLFTGS